jgi:HK97 family phage portal protein
LITGFKSLDSLFQKSVVAGQALAPNSAYTPWAYGEKSYGDLARNGYARNSAIAACALQYAIRLPEPPIIAKKGDKVLEQHPILELIRNNVAMDERQLWMHSGIYTFIGGNCYLYTLEGKRGQGVGVMPYSDAHFEPIASKSDGTLSHYEFKSKHGVVDVDKEKVIHLKWFSVDPANKLRALSPLRQLAQDAETDNLIAVAINSILQNDATPKSALILPIEAQQQAVANGMTPQAWLEMVEQKFKDKFSNSGKGMPIVFPGGGDVKRLALGFDELEAEAIRKIPESRICAVTGVPAILAGLNAGLSNATYSNYGQARLAFIQDTLSPIWQQWASTLTTGFGLHEEGVTLEFDTSKVVALQEVRIEKEKHVAFLRREGLLDPNEAREELGYKALEVVPNNELKASVGGAQTMTNLQVAYYAKQMDRGAAIANARHMFGFTEDEAKELFPELKKDSTPQLVPPKEVVIPKVEEEKV